MPNPAAPEVTPNAQKCEPTAANAVSVSPNTGAWVNGNYSQIIASTPAAWTLVGLVLEPAAVNCECELDIAIGAAASETVIATVAGFIQNSTTSGGCAWFWLPTRIPVDAIPAGSRVAVRIRKSDTSGTAWNVKVIYYNTVTATVGVTTNPTLTAPAAANAVALTPSGVSWTNGTYAEIHAGLTDIALLALVIDASAGTGTREMEIDLAKGTAGNEVVVGTVACRRRGNGCNNVLPFYIPIKVAGTNRFAARIRQSITDVNTVKVRLLYCSISGFGASSPQGSAAVHRVTASDGAMPTVATNGTAWVNSAWLELEDDVGAAACVLTGMAKDPTLIAQYEMDIGVGAAASEAVIATQADYKRGSTGISTTVPLAIPVDAIPASSRLTGRYRRNGSDTANVGMACSYVVKPL